MTGLDRITSDPAIMNGQPCIRGMRLTVRRVLEALVRSGALDVLVYAAGVMHVSAALDTAMPDVIAEMSAKRLGMTCVVTRAGQLAGIVTDGDLRRMLLAESLLLCGAGAGLGVMSAQS